MEDLVKAVIKQISVVGDDEQRTFVAVYHLSKAAKVGKIQKYIRFVKYKQIRRCQHLLHDLQQLVFSSAYLRKSDIGKVRHPCCVELLVDIRFEVIRVHSLAYIKQVLIVLHQLSHCLACFVCHDFFRAHFFAYCCDVLLILQEPFA